MPEVPRHRTPATREQLAGALEGHGLTERQRCFALGHLLLETRQGQSIQNNNPGNLTQSSRNTGPDSPAFWRPPWFEVDEHSSERDLRLHDRMLQGKAPSAFRAYGSLADGVAAYVSAVRRNFPSLLRARSIREFVGAIKSSGYAPDTDVRATIRTFEQLVQCRFRGASILPWLLGLGAGAGAWYLWRRKPWRN